MTIHKSAIKMKHRDQWYRYLLTREFDKGMSTLGVIMLNPSVADAEQDDPTIRRICDFAERWGYKRVIVGNLYAAVSTDPEALKEMEDPVGPLNNSFLKNIRYMSDQVVAGWGTKADEARVREVVGFMRPLLAFKKTKAGHPSHPLYLPKETKPIIYEV